MSILTFAQAWQAYRRAEPRLPAKPAPVSPRRIAGVGAIAEQFDLVVLDAWGVLNIADLPIATARAAVAGLRALGKRLLVLSNDGTREPPVAAARHRGRGFDFADDELVVGIELLPEVLAGLAPAGPGRFDRRPAGAARPAHRGDDTDGRRPRSL